MELEIKFDLIFKRMVIEMNDFWIIVYDSLYGIRVCIFDFNNNWVRLDTKSNLFNITHWMQLPSKPNKK